MADTAKVPHSLLCFVIGPIGKDGSPERKHADLLLHAVIKDVLEREAFGYKVKRADEDADPGMIGDRVISDILQAELVVADLTDLNPNAFYELGIRHSTLKPTIHVAKSGTLIPFDNVAHRTIFIDLGEWQSIQRGRTQLAAFVQAINSPGFQVSNPITQANASFKMRESADPRERVIAELQERVRSLELRSSFSAEIDASPSLDRIENLVKSGLLQGDAPDRVAQLVTAIVFGHDLEVQVKYLRERADLKSEEFGVFRRGNQFAGFIVPKKDFIAQKSE